MVIILAESRLQKTNKTKTVGQPSHPLSLMDLSLVVVCIY